MTQLDIIICVIPKIMPDAPTVGPAVLKAHLQDVGFTCEVIDLNVKLYNEFVKHGDEDQFFDQDAAFRCRDIDKIDEIFGDTYIKYQYFFDEWIAHFVKLNPRFIGLSLLSVMSSAFAIKLSQLIREHLPNTKIVWGGAEVTRGRTKQYYEAGLIDHWITGDGELPIVKLLQGDVDHNGIDDRTPFQLIDINSAQIPNYDDIMWDEYPHFNVPNPAYITGSRGCVKRCDFCNVYTIWPKYVFRSGANIAQEIITVKKKYNRTTFKFTDSLINGSMKAFREMLHILADYNNNCEHEEDRIRWHSQWIVRNLRQSPEEDYALMKASGCYALDVGIESFSQAVRYELGKKFTDEDMWWCFEMLHKYKMHHSLLMFVGHPFETDADHEITLTAIRQLYERGFAKARDDGNKKLMYISMANTMMLSDDTPVWAKVKDELEYWHNDWNWKFRDNTLDVRLQRLEEANDLLGELAGQGRTWMVKKKIEMIKRSYGNAAV